MCGIAGKLEFVPGVRVSRDALQAMAGVLAHRGPHGSGQYVGPGIGLAHRELRTEEGRHNGQPLSSEDGRVWVVADLALSNAQELRAELRAFGHQFRSPSPAELLVHGFEQWGEALLHRLRGAFAFALWDARRQRLLLARDRMGIKPLFYSLGPHALVFASEMKALLEDPDVPRDWDAAALRECLASGFLGAPRTVFRAISQLPAAHVLVGTRDRVRVRRYWVLPETGAAHPPTREDPASRMEPLLRDAVRAEVRSNPETFLLLSGGIASAAIAECAMAGRGVPLVTVGAGFDEAPYEEVQASREAARALETRHYTDLATPLLPELLPRLAWHLEEPCQGPDAIVRYCTLAAARRHGPVTLAGYGSALWNGRPRTGVRGALDGAAQAMRQAVPWLGGAGASLQGFHSREWRILRRLLAPDFCNGRNVPGALPGGSTAEPDGHSMVTGRAGSHDAIQSLADGVLPRVDRVAAAVGLDVRLPLLDWWLVELAVSLPLQVRSGHSRQGMLLRQVAARRIPDIGRRPVPDRIGARLAAWLRGPLAPMVSDLLLSGRFRQRGLFRPRAITRVWQEHLTGQRDHHRALWTLLMLELWFQQIVDGGHRLRRAA
jgi:asparagine synthase (glutamine-hydrolysing)